jgi:tripartite-type tricarboxylate transporter receptor subunit TctC
MAVSRRSVLMLLAGAASEIMATRAWGAGYPDKTIRFVVPFLVGGGSDTTARLVSPQVSDALGKQLVINNLSGANGNTGTAQVAHAAPDGYTITLAAANQTISMGLYKKPPFDILKDYAPITLISRTPSILAVHPALPAKTLKDLIALAKASPGKLDYASDQAGPQFLGMELLKSMTGMDLTNIPYVGTGAGTIAAIGGQVPVILAPAGIMLPFVKSGQLRGLAVSSSERLRSLPDLPTIAEAGAPGYDVSQWYGVLAPAGTPKHIIAMLNEAFVKVIKSPKLQRVFVEQLSIPVGNTPAEFAVFLKNDIALWGDAIKSSHLALN